VDYSIWRIIPLRNWGLELLKKFPIRMAYPLYKWLITIVITYNYMTI